MSGTSGHGEVSKYPQAVEGQVWETGKHWQHLMAAAIHPQ